MNTRWRSRLGVAALCLIVAGLIAGTWLVWRRVQGSREYKAALERYRAAGCPVDPMALKPAPLPPGQNGVNLYLRALDLDPDSFLKDPPDSPKVASSSDPRLEIPEGVELSEEEWKERRALVREFGSEIGMLKEAAAAGAVQFPLRYEDRWAMLMPHATRLVAAGKLLHWEVRLCAKDGKSAQAWEGIDAILAAGASVASEPTMVSQLVRLVVIEHGLDALECALDSLGPPPDALKSRLERRLAPDHIREGMRQSCLFELAMTQDTMAQFFEGGKLFPGIDEQRTGLVGFLALPEYHRGAARCLDRLVKMHRAMDRPAQSAIPELDAVLAEFQKDPTSFAFMIPGFARALRREREISARLLLAREAIRIRTGSPDLKSLPESVPSLPPDPFMGRPLKYMKTEKGFLLQADMTDSEWKDFWKLEKPLIWACPR